jgi:hypothetical protein
VRIVTSAFSALLVSVIFYGTSAEAQRSPVADDKAARIALVREFVREVQVLYRLQETSKKEFAEDPSANAKMMTSIRMGTRISLEMNDSINRLNIIPITGRWAEFRDFLKKFHQERAALVQEMTEISKMLLSGPQPGANYGAMVARAPELTARMEDIDKGIFEMSQAMFFALVDEGRQEVDGNLHHLLLTKTERTSMVQSIEKSFGPTLEDNNASHIVSAAWAIKYGLTRPHYKSADEP